MVVTLSRGELGESFRLMRLSHHLHIRDMEKLAGLHRQTIIDIEKGRPTPKQSSIDRYRAALEVLA